jgi:hypothetical protein
MFCDHVFSCPVVKVKARQHCNYHIYIGISVYDLSWNSYVHSTKIEPMYNNIVLQATLHKRSNRVETLMEQLKLSDDLAWVSKSLQILFPLDDQVRDGCK